MVKENNMERKVVDKLHLVYTIIIFVIVLLAIWLASPYIVCKEVLTKFEFAATITSIVLALVSIVYSMNSGQGISENLGSMRNASEKIGNVGDKLETLQTSLQTEILHLSSLEQKMQALHDKTDKTNEMIVELGQNKDIPTSDGVEGKFDFSSSSITGLIIIYACSLAKKTGKAYPAILVGNPYYVHGYITALEISASKHFRAMGMPDMTIHVSVFDNAYFGMATNPDYILQQIQSKGRYAKAQETLLKIQEFYNVK